MAATLVAAIAAKTEQHRKFVKDTDKMSASAKRLDTQVGKTEKRVGKLGKAFGSTRKLLGGLLAGFTAFTAIRSSISIIGQFEQSLTLVGAVSGASAAQLDALEASARQLGATTRFTASEAADGLLFLARAGFSVEDSIGALPATLNLAQVGMIDLGQAADFASNIVAQFGLAAVETTRVVDALVIASNRANTSVSQAAEALKFAGTVLGGFGIVVEEAANLIGVLGDRGIQASQAGTNLRAVFLKLAAPTTAGAAALAKFGLSLKDVDFSSNDVIDVFKRLEPVIKDTQAAVDIFGIRNIAAAQTIALSTERLEELRIAQRENVGEAERVAKAVDDTLIGSFKSLVSATQDIVLSLGEGGALGAFRSFTDTLTDAIRIMGGTVDATEGVSDSAIRLAAAIQTAGVAVLAFGARLAIVQVLAFVAALKAAVIAAGSLNAVLLANVFGIALVALGALTFGLFSYINEVERANDAQLALATSLLEATQGNVPNLKALERAAFDLRRALEFEDEVGEFRALGKQAKLLESTLFELQRVSAEGLRPDELFSFKDIAKILPETDARGLAKAFGLTLEEGIVSGARQISRDALITAIEFSIEQLRKEAAGTDAEFDLPVSPNVVISPEAQANAAEQLAQLAANLQFERGLIGASTAEEERAVFARNAFNIATDAKVKGSALLVGALTTEFEALQKLRLEETERQRIAAEELQTRIRSGDAAKNALENIRFEQTLIGLSNQERQKAILLRSLEAQAVGLTADEITLLLTLYEQEIDKLNRLTEAAGDGADAQKQLIGQIGDSLRGGLEDAILELDNLRDIGLAVFEDIRRAAVRAAIAAAFGGQGTPFSFNFGENKALGGAFTTGGRELPGLQKGGVISEPSLINSAAGIRQIAENEPEGVLPLSRGRGGRLGVEVTNADAGGQTKAAMTLIMNINGVTDADSFARNERQILSRAQRTLNRRGA